jgi:hypothetical protein
MLFLLSQLFLYQVGNLTVKRSPVMLVPDQIRDNGSGIRFTILMTVSQGQNLDNYYLKIFKSFRINRLSHFL